MSFVSEHAGKGLWSLFLFICYFQVVEEEVFVDRNEVNIYNYLPALKSCFPLNSPAKGRFKIKAI